MHWLDEQHENPTDAALARLARYGKFKAHDQSEF